MEIAGLRNLTNSGKVTTVLAVLLSALAGCLGTTTWAQSHDENSAGPVLIAGGVMAGNTLTKVAPVFPPAAKEQRIQGFVKLHLLISKTGTVEKLMLMSGAPVLQISAVDAVKRWTYQPYLLNGEPTEVDTTVQVSYSFVNEISTDRWFQPLLLIQPLLWMGQRGWNRKQ